MAGMNDKRVEKKVPIRRCSGCGERFPKSDMLRVLRTPEGEIVVDFVGKRSGRGAYLCKNVECFKRAQKSRRIATALECQISDEIYERLLQEIKADE
jgi:predicted RNA-binding protein YlxR (DUF448 family)